MAEWKRINTYLKKGSLTDQWVKGEQMVDLRKTNSGWVLETFDMKRKRDNIKEFYKSRSKGLKRAKILMRRN